MKLSIWRKWYVNDQIEIKLWMDYWVKLDFSTNVLNNSMSEAQSACPTPKRLTDDTKLNK